MGKNNKARRAAKAKQRRNEARARSEHFGFDPRRDTDRHQADLVAAALERAAEFRAQRQNRGVNEMLGRILTADRRVVGETAAGELRRAVAVLWRNGWQPAEVARQARRSGGTAVESLAVAAIADDHAARNPTTIDPRWQQQIDSIGAGPSNDRSRPGLAGLIKGTGVHDGSDAAFAERLGTVIDTLAALGAVHPLEELIPPPGGWTNLSRPATRAETHRHDTEVDRQLVDRVRNLLAKAESTEFDAEAEAFTAKAQELITRHAIDTAVLADAADAKERPVTIRVAIDDPYADVKSLLLQTIGSANRCRVVYHGSVSLSTVVGFEADVMATELLHTSLLVQAQSGIAAAARNAPPGSRERKASFKSAFLLAFTQRIGQRLDEINAHVMGEAESEGRSVLPVLRSRAAEVDDEFAARFPEISSNSVRTGSDALGWATGRSAADRAKLNLADLTTEQQAARAPAPDQFALPGLAAG